MPITLGSVTLLKPVLLNRAHPISASEVVLLGGKRDQDAELNYGMEFTFQCQSPNITDFEAILAMIGVLQELKIDYGEGDVSYGNFMIVGAPTCRTMDRTKSQFIFEFTIRKHTAT